MKSERGFTLIELLVVIAIVGVLAFLGVTAYRAYLKKATYAATSSGYQYARTSLEGGVNNIDNPPGTIEMYEQSSPGSPADPEALALLPGFKLGKDMKIRVSYNPDCNDLSCPREFLQINHCQGEEYIRWIRFGNGLEMLFGHLQGAGCA